MRVGIDIGGTKIEDVVVDTDRRVLSRRRVATPRADYAAILASLSELIRTLEADVSCHCAVGVGMPGILSPHTGLVKNSNTTVLNAKPFYRDLSRCSIGTLGLRMTPIALPYPRQLAAAQTVTDACLV